MKVSFEQLLNGEGHQVSLINEPIEQPKRETATERARRRWFERTPETKKDDA